MSLQAINFDLQITPGSVPPVLHMAQYDSGRQYTAYLKDETNTAFIPGAGATAKIKGFNAAGVAWEQAATVDGSTVVFTPSGAATDQFGVMPVTIEITVGDETLTPLLVVFDIQRAGYTNEEATRSPEFQTAIEAAVAAAIEDGGLGFTEDFKEALLACFAHVAWTDEHGQDYYDALADALYPTPGPVTLVSITANYLQDRPIYSGDPLDKVQLDLSVTANYSDGTSVALADDAYSLSGTLTVGTSTITVTYSGKTTTFDVTVTAPLYALTSGTHTFTTQTYGKYITISNGNHVKLGLAKVTAQGANQGSFFNLSDLAKNKTTAKQDTNNAAVNNLSDVMFTIPNGASVKWEVKNMNYTGSELLAQSYSEFNVGMRKTSASTGVIDAVGYPAGTERMSVEKTFTEATEASCVFVYAAFTNEVELEFDIYLTVNGERWI